MAAETSVPNTNEQPLTPTLQIAVDLLTQYLQREQPEVINNLREVRRRLLGDNQGVDFSNTTMRDAYRVLKEREALADAAGREPEVHVPPIEDKQATVENFLMQYLLQLTPDERKEPVILGELQKKLEAVHPTIDISQITIGRALKAIRQQQEKAREQGETYITVPELKLQLPRRSRATQILRYARAGWSNQRIAKKLHVSTHTIADILAEKGETTPTVEKSFEPEMEENLVRLWNEGIPWGDMWKNLHLNEEDFKTLYLRLQRQGRLEKRSKEALAQRTEFITNYLLQGWEPEDIYARLTDSTYPQMSVQNFNDFLSKLYKQYIPGINEQDLGSWRFQKRQEIREQEEAARRQRELLAQKELQRKTSELQSQLRGFMRYGGRIYFTSDFQIKEIKRDSIEVQVRSASSWNKNGPLSYEEVEDMRVIGEEPIVYKRVGNTPKGVRGELVYNPNTRTKIYSLVKNVARFSERGDLMLRILDQYRAETIIALAGNNKELLLELDRKVPTILDIFQATKAS